MNRLLIESMCKKVKCQQHNGDVALNGIKETTATPEKCSLEIEMDWKIIATWPGRP